MIVVLTGSNSFALRQTLRRLVVDSGVEPERFEASDIETSQLVDLLQGQSLFSEQRIVIIDGADQEKSLWSKFKDVLGDVNPDTTLVLIANSPDKRTATYKWLQKNAKLVDHPLWRGSDTGSAKKWLQEYAKQQAVLLPAGMADEMVIRATRGADDGKPIIDQQQLANAVNQLSHSKAEINSDMLDVVLPPSTHENIFELLVTALRRETAKIEILVDHLSQNEDGHRAMGLLVSQLANLSALTIADSSVPVEKIASDIGAHRYALGQLSGHAGNLSKSQLATVVEAIADADVRMKQGQAEPWVLIKTALLKISQN